MLVSVSLTSPQQPDVYQDLIIETNVALLFKDFMTLVEKVSEFPDLESFLRCQPAESAFRDLLGAADSSHRRVLLIRTRSKYEGGVACYAVPATRSKALLKVIDEAPGLSDVVGMAPVIQHPDFIAENEKNQTEGEEVQDLHQWLFDRGHFIISSEDVKELQSKDSFESRLSFLDELNRRKEEWESTRCSTLE
jgi:hypothetical protein